MKLEYIKKWMCEIAMKYNATLFYKFTHSTHFIICPQDIEVKDEFRDIALDFLFSFEDKYNEDILIISEKDKSFSFESYDYQTNIAYAFVNTELSKDISETKINSSKSFSTPIKGNPSKKSGVDCRFVAYI